MKSRRHFVQQTAAAATLAGLGDAGFLGALPRVSADEARPGPEMVKFRPEIEPTVRLIEDTPRNKLTEAIAERIRKGRLSYQELLAALLLAGVRNIQPRPSVGFKFHAVLVVNSAHLASIASPDRDRWLPIFWALDDFKRSQHRDEREGNWTLQPVDETRVPPAHRARLAFIEAMDNWDEEAADAAVAGLARTAGAHEIFELFALYGARDFRSIGHKAIFVANSWRTLQTIGWQHAEPILRSLAYALLNHTGEPNPAKSDLAPDRPGRSNEELAHRIRKDWRAGKPDTYATAEMLEVLRNGSSEDACRQVVRTLNEGVAPQSIYDALFAGSGELVMRQPGIIALHAVTSTNALRYAFRTAANDETRRRLLLQNAAFLTLFRDAMPGRGTVGNGRIDRLEPAAPDTPDAPAAIDAILGDVSGNSSRAARKLLGYLEAGGDPKQFLDAARRMIFLKGRDAHDYKFSSAALEDFYHVSPEWRNRFLATSARLLRGSGDRDNSLVKRTRAALTTN